MALHGNVIITDYINYTDMCNISSNVDREHNFNATLAFFVFKKWQNNVITNISIVTSKYDLTGSRYSDTVPFTDFQRISMYKLMFNINFNCIYIFLKTLTYKKKNIACCSLEKAQHVPKFCL